MTWQDIVFIGTFLVLWSLFISIVLPRFGVGT